ncbi:MAG: asparagine synthase (glutamine-hydrolyzing), partial [Candidatus Lokiarchaeota archaeon]|nr:asparagine synthase (glutamine-hydrolyzing) [Candidatus Lokiarchaeota archaeon]
MCGIAGVFNIDGNPVNEQIIREMTIRLAHRGQDDEGHFFQGNIALGHKRLAILDLSKKGKQPMRSSNGKWIIVYNGCIYNFRELRDELIKRGKSFTTETDTEVILEGLDFHGISFIERLNGMFAIGVWNNEEKALYLFRDRFGVKPLYYWFNGKTLVFASEIKAILEHPDYRIEVDLGALNEYFTFQNLFTYRTLFKGVTLLPQANSVRIDASSSFIKHHSWWDYDFSQPDEKMTFEDAQAETKRLFEQAVRRQMISDVPVGSYLSGGLDSGSITTVASGEVDRLSTFTCGFDMNRVAGVEVNYDERRAAELISNYLGTEQYEQVMNAGDLRWALSRVIWHLEDLKVGMSYPNYYISRLASKFVKVCLSGTGGDELFGGYPWRYYRVFAALNREFFFNNYYNYWQRLVPDSDRQDSFYRNEIKKQIDINEPRQIFERVFTFNPSLRYETPEQHIQNSLYFEIKTFL